MTTNQNATNRPVFTIAGQIAQLDSRDDSARFALFVKLYDAGIKADDLTAKGDAFADFRDGYLVAWQGADFAKAFDGAAGKVELTGKVIDRLTGKWVHTVMTKTAWQMALASKIAKARASYAAWLAAGEPKADGNGANANTPRDLSDRITDEIGKLVKAVKKDAGSETPASKFDHKEMLAAFQRAIDLAK